MRFAPNYKSFFKKCAAYREASDLTFCEGATMSVIGLLSKLTAITMRRLPDDVIVIEVAAIATAVVHQRRHPNHDGADTEA
jgi:hypothetical protein